VAETPRLPSDRSFGILFVVVFALLAAWQAWAGRPMWAAGFVVLSASMLGCALLRPAMLHPLNRAWMKFGALLHRIVNPVVLGAIFYVVIVPVGLVMHLIRRDALRLRLDPEARSYWIERTPPGPPPDSLPHQY
jgi:hypothetical protein